MSRAAHTNHQWTVAARPDPDLKTEHFARREVILRPLRTGEVLLKTLYLNIAPVMRMYMQSGSVGVANERPLDIGDVIHGRGVAVVVESRHQGYAAGQFVHGQIGWQTHKISAMTPEEKMRVMPPRGLPAWYGLSALGMTGYSAWCGLVSRGEPKAGKPVLVSGAAGGVGSLVVQMARALGCSPVVGLAGTDQKCQALIELGADAMINYRHDALEQQIKAQFPDGIDLYFDNVGGEILEAALENLAPGARVVLCGSISEYSRAQPFGPRNYTRLRAKEADMRGFFVYNHQHDFARAEHAIARWIKSGELTPLVDFCDGFDHMPAALMGLYRGRNIGKCIVRLDPSQEPVC